MAIYDARRRWSKFYLGLCYLAVAIGLSWLAIILATLLFEGLRNISPAIFTQMTPPPGADGGLLNAITGSLIMTTLGVAIGTPLGMLAGTYMAEYGRYSKRTFDRDRSLCLRGHGRENGPFLRARRGRVACRHRRSGCRSYDRGYAAFG